MNTGHFLTEQTYISTGEPVGSRMLSKHEGVDLSPATLRNIMTDLTQKKLLEQPHTSAGRIPTDKGYRLYVDYRIPNQDIPVQTAERPLQLLPENSEKPDGIFRAVVDYLSGETKFMAVLTTPCPLDTVFKKLEFIRLSENRIVIVILTVAGMVFHKTVYLRDRIDDAILHEVSDMMTARFCDSSFRDIRENLSVVFSEDSGQENLRFSPVIRLCRKAFSVNEHGDLFSSGFENIYRMDSKIDHVYLSEFFRVMSDQQPIIRVLEQNAKQSHVSILIGDETNIEELSRFALVAAPYGTSHRQLGSVGVIGPKRMSYDRVCGLIKDTADRLSNELNAMMTHL
ncbi:hypothetical protein CHS0354_001998 [Potamilus streckersoni]|uniref:Heat-inducible transcription repressor HrcA C-terminal domain-containing protein n=1 Tax=Potamilus streckersoni TaxID=2493646 RepID=A0AAE0T5F5_9BIVA|nr:hypothetical protein CHS0354_001998 [Potamilus streckersoni]